MVKDQVQYFGVEWHMYVWLGRLLALALILFGTLRAAIGYYVATYFVDQAAYEAATARYLGSTTTGEAIDNGIVLVAIGIVVGLLTHIAAKSGKKEA